MELGKLMLSMERAKRIDDAIRFKKPDRVPHIWNSGMWQVHDHGAQLSKALRDYALSDEIVYSFHEKYPMDYSRSYLQLLCHPFGATDVLGPGAYVVDDEKGVVSLNDMALLKADEFEMFIEDKGRYTWDVLMPRKYSGFKDLTVADFRKVIDLFFQYYGKMVEQIQIGCTKYGNPPLFKYIVPTLGIENLFNHFSGMKETSLVMRRNPELLERACRLWDQQVEAALETYEKSEDDIAACGIHLLMLAHHFLNKKQWEKFYWPVLKKVLDKAVEKDLTVFIYAEGKLLRFAEYFQDYPKGLIAVQSEEDDIYEMAKAFPNCCVVGGLSTNLLYNGTKEDCINRIKQLTTDLHRDGGLIISEDKMITYSVDMKAENCSAICDYMENHQKIKGAGSKFSKKLENFRSLMKMAPAKNDGQNQSSAVQVPVSGEINWSQKLDDYDACIKEFAKIYGMDEQTMKGHLDAVTAKVVTL